MLEEIPPGQIIVRTITNYTGYLCNSYITSTRDVSGLNCDARGRVAPEGGAI